MGCTTDREFTLFAVRVTLPRRLFKFVNVIIATRGMSVNSRNGFFLKIKFCNFYAVHPSYNEAMRMESLPVQGRARPVVYPDALDELKEAWKLLGFPESQPTIVIVGGAGGMSDGDVASVQTFFEKHLLPFALIKNAVILDGGTDTGVMAALGRACEAGGVEDFPMIGVTARDIENVETMLEPHHSHFIFCPGSKWGDESEWIAAAASALCDSLPTVAVLINGGQITWEDARNNVQYGRPVLIAEGSGRTADVIASTSLGIGTDSNALALIRTGRVHVANFFKEPEGFIRKMNDLMK